MSNTSRHLTAAIAWLFAPLVVIPAFVWGALPATPLLSTLVSILWGLGFVCVFASWAFRDAPAHGRSRNVALGFTAAWFLVFFFAVFPYLFVTRGAKGGLVASLKFLSFCLALAIAWLGVPAIFGRLF